VRAWFGSRPALTRPPRQHAPWCAARPEPITPPRPGASRPCESAERMPPTTKLTDGRGGGLQAILADPTGGRSQARQRSEVLERRSSAHGSVTCLFAPDVPHAATTAQHLMYHMLHPLRSFGRSQSRRSPRRSFSARASSRSSSPRALPLAQPSSSPPSSSVSPPRPSPRCTLSAFLRVPFICGAEAPLRLQPLHQ
jgi:hypothetical protein